MITPKEKIELIIKEAWSEIANDLYNDSFIRFCFLSKSAVVDFDKNILKIVVSNEHYNPTSCFNKDAFIELEKRMEKETGINIKIKLIPYDFNYI